MVTNKPLRTFIYLPVFLKDEYKCCAVYKLVGAQIKEGDIFIVDKRPPTFEEQKKAREFKAVKIQYNLFDTSCMVTLEPITFDDQKELNKFMNEKSKL